ncbi:MAG TPA: hypothetical protein VKB78_16030, partial [Pirellulales bacterium]|nr:hypothetical protein [Pirellulales bacterium]
AAAKIPEYWIVNLPQRQVEIHREPKAMESEELVYQSSRVVDASGTIAVVLDGRQFGDVAVASILPKRPDDQA